ncbi:hypothetical protein [Burkholderia vietnamiensis]|uniref:hypothetical protein n=1 Tax=Burkholderia vietnamiensis TaxID=60552 RepID=UPI0012DB101B|nr:hypothetical protein [Burkholderia vietnamiensis]HDR9057452.1 hypothetical protein [Burkholderia vietnamiensis]
MQQVLLELLREQVYADQIARGIMALVDKAVWGVAAPVQVVDVARVVDVAVK